MELIMRRILLAALAIAALAAIPTAASAQHYWGGDPYGRSPLFGYPPPPAYGYVTEAPLAHGEVYLAPGTTTVAPGTVYEDHALIINGRRYYRDCWWEWGRRQCGLKPWW